MTDPATCCQMWYVLRCCSGQVRAFAGWPGTRHLFTLQPRQPGGSAAPAPEQLLELKILRTSVADPSPDPVMWTGLQPGEVAVGPRKDVLLVRCGGEAAEGGVLEIRELQPAARKAMSARAFVNGLKDRRLVHQIMPRVGC